MNWIEFSLIIYFWLFSIMMVFYDKVLSLFKLVWGMFFESVNCIDCLYLENIV